MTTTATIIRLPESLQTLIDARLDTIDRMLLGRVPRQDRLAIVRDLETQIFELLPARDIDDLGRDDLLAVLARLDPPEAYLPEEFQASPASAGFPSPRLRPTVGHEEVSKGAKVGGIMGVTALVWGAFLPVPLILLVASTGAIQEVYAIGCFGLIGLVSLGGIVSIILGIYTRFRDAWAVLGVVAGGFAMVFSWLSGLLLFFNL